MATVASFRLPKPVPAAAASVKGPQGRSVMSSVLQNAHVSLNASYSRPNPNGIDLEGILVYARAESKTVKNPQGAEVTLKYCKYAVTLMNCKKFATLHSNAFHYIPERNAVRLQRSDVCKKYDALMTYEAALTHALSKRPELKLNAREEIVRGLQGSWPANEKEFTQHKGAFTVSFDLPPLSESPKYEFKDGDKIYFEVSNGKELPIGTLVSVEGFYADVWLLDPSKRKKDSTFPPPTLEELEAKAIKYHALYDPATGASLSESFRANHVRAQSGAFNDLPFAQRTLSIIDASSQFWFNNTIDNVDGLDDISAVFALVIEEAPKQAELDMSNSKTHGCIINAAKPGRRNAKTGVFTTSDDPETYTFTKAIGNNETQTSAFYPVVVPVTNWRFVPKTDLEGYAKYRSFYSKEEEVVSDDGVPGYLLMRAYEVHADGWSSFCRMSGIADLDAWKDVNASLTLPAVAMLRPKKAEKASTNADTIDMDVINLDWNMEQLLRTYGTPCTPAFGGRAFGDKNVVPVINFGTEQVKENYEDTNYITRSIRNTGNEMYVKRIINATEFSGGDLKPYMDPKNGYECAVLIVPNLADLAALKKKNEDQYLRKKAAIAADIARLREVNSAQEGDAALEKFATDVLKIDVDAFGQHSKDYRVMVWFFKRLETIFPPDVLNTPLWKQQQQPKPAVAPGPPESQQKQQSNVAPTPELPPSLKREHATLGEAPQPDADEPPVKRQRTGDAFSGASSQELLGSDDAAEMGM